MAWAPLKPVTAVEEAPAAEPATADFTAEAPVETTQPLLPAQQTPADAADNAAPAADPGEQR
ncbi:hypothetical protein ACFQ1I_29150 [Kitasatospora arboriphila]